MSEKNAKKTVPTGIVRAMDGLGRAVIPKEYRDLAGLNPNDPVTVTMEDGAVVIRPYDHPGFLKLRLEQLRSTVTEHYLGMAASPEEKRAAAELVARLNMAIAACGPLSAAKALRQDETRRPGKNTHDGKEAEAHAQA